MFRRWEAEALRLLDLGLVAPGYDCVIKCSHLFNLLDARGAISVSERVGFIARVRKLARKSAVAFLKQREALGFPLLKDEAERAKWAKPEGNGDATQPAAGAGSAAGTAKASSDAPARGAGGRS